MFDGNLTTLTTRVKKEHAMLSLFFRSLCEHETSTIMNQNPPSPHFGEPLPRPSSGEFITAMSHLYRAEAANALTWRSRLDTTTNWSIVTTAAAISFALGDTDLQRHVVILLVSILVTFFLMIEARRYRHYDIWQTRVRLMESDFIAPMLDPESSPTTTNWRQLLAADLRLPRYHISFIEALGWRLRRNYVWIYLTHLLTWFVKIAIHPDTITSFGDIIIRAQVGPIPGVVMILCGVLFNGSLIGAAITSGLLTRFHTASGEIMSGRETRRKINYAE
jgi:uncharacterized membrane protein